MTNPLFAAKKARILKDLQRPDSEYSDLSPKGSIDEGIRELIDEINEIESFVTTSSCAGRISVFLEGAKKTQHGQASSIEGEVDSGIAGPGGKGGGRWLYVNHGPIDMLPATDAHQSLHRLFDMTPKKEGNEGTEFKVWPATRLVHFKIEAMILHILTSSLSAATPLLTAGFRAGFRESGATSIDSPTPMVAIRSNGLALDSVIGCFDEATSEVTSLVSEDYLRLLAGLANERLKVNAEKIARFRVALREGIGDSAEKNDGNREDQGARRARKRAEGLARRDALRDERREKSAKETGLAEDDVQHLDMF